MGKYSWCMFVVKAGSKGKEPFCRPLRRHQNFILAPPVSELRSLVLFSSTYCTRFGAGVPAEAKSESVLAVDDLRTLACACLSLLRHQHRYALCALSILSIRPIRSYSFRSDYSGFANLFLLSLITTTAVSNLHLATKTLFSLLTVIFQASPDFGFNHTVRFWLRYFWRIV